MGEGHPRQRGSGWLTLPVPLSRAPGLLGLTCRPAVGPHVLHDPAVPGWLLSWAIQFRGSSYPTSAPGAGGLNGVQEEELTPSEMRSLEKDLVGPGIGPILSPWQTSLLRAYPAPPWELQLGSVGVTGENRRALHL